MISDNVSHRTSIRYNKSFHCDLSILVWVIYYMNWNIMFKTINVILTLYSYSASYDQTKLSSLNCLKNLLSRHVRKCSYRKIWGTTEHWWLTTHHSGLSTLPSRRTRAPIISWYCWFCFINLHDLYPLDNV